MSSTREIRRRIRSAKNVSQITRAMEMVSASKMRKAQRNVLATRPYIDRMIDLMGELTGRMVGGTRRGTLMEERETVERVGVLVITPDRGLCGSLVTNVLRRTSQFILEQREAGREVVVYAIGKKGRDYLRRTRQSIQAEIIDLSDAPRLEDILGVATDMIKSFLGDRATEGEENWRIDEAYIIYSEFVNTLVQRPAVKRVMPVEPVVEPPERQVDYTYEPSQEEVLDALLPRYVEALLYQSVLESIASEHSARMVAMRNATDNAKELVRDLTLSYNKARQSNITKEVSEISTGAMYLEG